MCLANVPVPGCWLENHILFRTKDKLSLYKVIGVENENEPASESENALFCIRFFFFFNLTHRPDSKVEKW